MNDLSNVVLIIKIGCFDLTSHSIQCVLFNEANLRIYVNLRVLLDHHTTMLITTVFFCHTNIPSYTSTQGVTREL